MNISKKEKIIGVIIILFILINFIPTSYYVMSPGIAQELSPIITVEDGNKGKSKGDFLLTAVASQKATVWDCIYISIFNPEGKELDSMTEQLPKGIDMNKYIQIMSQLMEESKLHAQSVAFKEADYQVKVNGEGAEVVEVLKNGSAKGKLKKEDIIINIDGKKVEFATDAVEYIRKHKIGDKVNITVTRNGKKKDFKLKTVEIKNNPDKASIGVLITTKNLKYDFPKEVNFKTKNIVGPSAGGMFALEIYNQLQAEDITNGNRIAGTGTISSDGTIGKIDGVIQKVLAAEKVGADIFIAPEANYKKAKKTAKNIQIISVKTFSDAINSLKNIK